MDDRKNIDIVMIWVDGSDPIWRAKKNEYQGKNTDADIVDAGDERYQDWDNLRYWFRGVEKFMPWVHRVYFVTEGHIPKWLNLNAEKLVHVKHSDYIPEEYLPTFSSHPIELNLHRIKGLSERFIYFNDDMFVIRPMSKGMFFQGMKPVHPARIHGVLPRNDGGVMPHIYVNMISALNRHFDFHTCLKQNKGKWFNPFAVGIKDVIGNLYNSNYAQFPGIGNEHLPVPILKKTVKEVWKCEPELMHQTCTHRFRNEQDVSQYMFRYWQIASGNFVPIKENKLGVKITIQAENKELLSIIENQKYPMVCLNDMGRTSAEDFSRVRDQFNKAFESILPEKSAFEL